MPVTVRWILFSTITVELISVFRLNLQSLGSLTSVTKPGIHLGSIQSLSGNNNFVVWITEDICLPNVFCDFYFFGKS